VSKTLENKIEKPIFVLGCCNSGTTILGRAIQSHNDVNGPEDEGPLTPGWPKELTHFLCPHTFRVWAHPIFSKGKEYFPGDNLAYYLTELTEKNSSQVKSFYSQFIDNKERISDHSPQLVLRARALQGIFPDAYFVIIVRNGYAVSEGIKRKRFYDPDRPHMSGFETRIEDAAVQWREANRILLSYIDHKQLSKVMTVQYENLINNTKDVLIGVLKFCNLKPINYYFPKFITNNNEKQIARLSAYEIDTITKVAQPMLTHFGYDVPS
jgi:hypothetical protein